jgi:hypothetical protein
MPSWEGVDVSWVLQDRDVRVGRRRQHGVIGVDLMQGQVFEFHYEGVTPFVAIGAFNVSCATDLAAAGFQRVGQGRYWVAGGASDVQPANVPVVYFDLAKEDVLDTPIGIDGWAQIDTGYDDAVYPLAVDINQPMYDRLVAAGVALIEIEGVQITDCTGATQQRRAFRAPEHVLRIETDEGELIAAVMTATFILKESTAACGGIGADPRPGAQIGASFLHSFGVTVFSGPTKEVWINTAARQPQ